MSYPLPVMIHVAAGGVAIVAGFSALAVSKGGSLHRRAGTVFFVSMLLMAGFAAALGVRAGQSGNVVAGLFTLYLVATAWSAVRQPAGGLGPVERFGGLAALSIAGVSLAFAVQVATGAAPAATDVPIAARFIFGGLAALAGALDLKVVRQGGLSGYPRLRRHIWRMCLALFVAAGSFFLGQQDEMPAAVRGSPLLMIPPFTALGALAWWMATSRARRRARTA